MNEKERLHRRHLGKERIRSLKTSRRRNSGNQRRFHSGENGKQDQECYKCGMKGHWSKTALLSI
jgi:hypothetical protein